VVDHRAVAVLEPGGRLVLMDLADGRKIVEEQLEPEPHLFDFTVIAGPGQHLVVTQSLDFEEEDEDGDAILPLGGVESLRIRHGRVYAFDAMGEPLWPGPLAVEDHFLPAGQPERLPVLVFARHKKVRLPTGHARTDTDLLILDKRTGQVIDELHFETANNSFRLTGDPERNTVEIQLQRNTIQLTFTGKTREQTEADSPGTLRAIFDALKEAAGKAGS
jgi:hypothetical protein